ncbi:putative RNA-directed DNA polymerase, partial [Tanacetum coccineum]
LLCKQAEKGVQLHAEQSDWLADTDEENANPLSLVATAQPHQDPYYQASKSHKSYAPTSKATLSTRSHATTRHKDKEMQKNLALIAKYFKKLYKPTNNNLKTSSNTKNKNVDTTLRYKNDNQNERFGNQRIVNVVEARETVDCQVVQQTGIQCFNCNEFGHFAKECRKPKRVKDSTYHKEKMLLCKQAEKGVQLHAEQSDWLADTDEEIDEQELEAHYSYMAKIQEVPTADSGTDTEPLEQVQYDAGYNVFANERQHSEQPKSISNTCVVEKVDSNVIPDSSNMCDNDKLEHKLNETLGLLAQKYIDIKEGLKLKAYEISVVKEKHDDLVKQSILTKSHYEGLVKEKTK